MNPLLLSAAILMGLAVGVAIYAGRAWFAQRFETDQAWMRETYLRFYPDPINARNYTIGYYAAFVILLITLLIMIPIPLIAIFLWILLLYFPRLFIAVAWQHRVKKIDVQIPQSVATISNSMRAGLTLVQAVTRMSQQAPEPIKSEFKIMANQYGYGADMDTVLRNAKARLNLADFSLFASALLLNREMGGDISETLTRISKSLDKLREMRKTVEAHTSEGRTNIKVLLAAPVFMLGVMSIVMSKGVGLLFTTLPGWGILTVAGLLSGAGVYFANRITKSDI